MRRATSGLGQHTTGRAMRAIPLASWRSFMRSRRSEAALIVAGPIPNQLGVIGQHETNSGSPSSGIRRAHSALAASSSRSTSAR